AVVSEFREEGIVDPVTAVVAALVAGATAGLKGVASGAVQDAYARLKKLLVGKISKLSDLDKAPDNAQHRSAVEKEVREAQLAGDRDIREQSRQLLKAIEAEPPAKLASYGISIGQIRAAGNVLFEDVDAGAGDFLAKDIDAGGNLLVRGTKARQS